MVAQRIPRLITWLNVGFFFVYKPVHKPVHYSVEETVHNSLFFTKPKYTYGSLTVYFKKLSIKISKMFDSRTAATDNRNITRYGEWEQWGGTGCYGDLKQSLHVHCTSSKSLSPEENKNVFLRNRRRCSQSLSDACPKNTASSLALTHPLVAIH